MGGWRVRTSRSIDCDCDGIRAIRCDSSNHSARDICKTEYIPYGGIVYRPPAFMATFPDGCRESVLTYKDFNISEIDDGFMLEVYLEDKPYNVDVTLCYKLRTFPLLSIQHHSLYSPY